MQVLFHSLGQPLLHFLPIGTGLFWLFSLLNNPDPKAEAYISLIQSQTLQRAPTFRDLEGLIDNHISEQVLVRSTVMMS